MNYLLLITVLFFSNALMAEDMSSNEKFESISSALTHFSERECNQGRHNFSGDLVTPHQAEEISTCFMSKDFWEAQNQYGGDSAPYGDGLEIACTSALNYTCSSAFKRAAMNLFRVYNVKVINKAGDYKHDGRWGDSRGALNHVLIMPNIDGVVNISVNGSTVDFIPSENIICNNEQGSCWERF